jgi:hypothetical protein
MFMGPDFGVFFTHDLYQFDDESQAIEAMSMASNQLDCDEWIAEDPTSGEELRYTVDVLELPALGDETVAVSLNINPVSDDQAGSGEMFGELSSEIVLVRQGNRFSTFNHMGWFAQDQLDLEAIVTSAVERIEQGQ